MLTLPPPFRVWGVLVGSSWGCVCSELVPAWAQGLGTAEVLQWLHRARRHRGRAPALNGLWSWPRAAIAACCKQALMGLIQQVCLDGHRWDTDRPHACAGAAVWHSHLAGVHQPFLYGSSPCSPAVRGAVWPHQVELAARCFVALQVPSLLHGICATTALIAPVTTFHSHFPLAAPKGDRVTLNRPRLCG